MNKLLSIIGLLLIAHITFAGHHESGHMKKGDVMGYENYEDGRT